MLKKAGYLVVCAAVWVWAAVCQADSGGLVTVDLDGSDGVIVVQGGLTYRHGESFGQSRVRR